MRSELDRRNDVFPKDVYTVAEAAAVIGVSDKLLYRLSRSEDGPFPVRMLPGRVRGGIVLRDEMLEWLKDCAPLVAEASKRAGK